MSICLVIFYFIPVQQPMWSYDPTPPYSLEDSIDGFIQLGNNPLLLVAIMGTIFSIAFFNYAGQTVTKELSATTRMVLDSVRTLVIWAFSISIGWQKFQYLQVGLIIMMWVNPKEGLTDQFYVVIHFNDINSIISGNWIRCSSHWNVVIQWSFDYASIS